MQPISTSFNNQTTQITSGKDEKIKIEKNYELEIEEIVNDYTDKWVTRPNIEKVKNTVAQWIYTSFALFLIEQDETHKKNFKELNEVARSFHEYLVEPQGSLYLERVIICRDSKFNEIQALGMTRTSCLNGGKKYCFLMNLVTNPQNVRSQITKSLQTKVEGAGSKIISWLKDKSLERQWSAIYLEAVPTAKKFYEKCQLIEYTGSEIDKICNDQIAMIWKSTHQTNEYNSTVIESSLSSSESKSDSKEEKQEEAVQIDAASLFDNFDVDLK